MTLSRLGRTLIGAALTVMLGSFALSPAVAVTGSTITWVNDIADGSTYAYGQVPTVAPTCRAVDETLAAVDCKVSGYDATMGVHMLTATGPGCFSAASAGLNYRAADIAALAVTMCRARAFAYTQEHSLDPRNLPHLDQDSA